MKSIKEKAEAYDKVLEWATEAHKVCDGMLKEDLEHLFPELKESEDERIRKMLIEQMERWHECALENNVVQDIKDSADAIAWLEKQGKHSNFLSKIQVGDKVTRNEDGVLVNLSQLKRVAKPAEEYNITGISSKNAQGKLGEMIKNLKTVSKVLEQKPETDFSDLRTWKYIVDAVWTEKEGIGQYLDSPFTEEVAKKLQKRFGNIEQKPTNNQFTTEQASVLDKHIDKFLEKKSAWSEKYIADVFEKVGLAKIAREQSNDSLTNALQDAMIELSKFTPQPKQEWSEEDEVLLKLSVENLTELKDRYGEKYGRVGECIDWLESKLESFRPQNTWKPSDEQMNTLEYYMHTLVCNEHKEILFGLYSCLKKLREE